LIGAPKWAVARAPVGPLRSHNSHNSREAA